MTKRLVLGAAMLLTLASCGKNSGEYQTLKQQYDSLALINQNYEAELHETDSLVDQCPDELPGDLLRRRDDQCQSS